MGNLDKVIEAINIPKAVIDEADKFLSSLLGSAVKETGELITDKIRYRRFKNQVTILQKAEELLNQSGLKAKNVSLKTLVPLIEKSSLEEDGNLQDMWASLLANASQSDTESGLHAICIEVLSSISPLEAKMLKIILEKYYRDLPKVVEWSSRVFSDVRKVRLSSIYISPSELFSKAGVTDEKGELLLDNLLRLNLLRWYNVGMKKSPIPDEGGIMFLDLGNINIHLTKLGLKVLLECTKVPASRRVDA